jgi:hypothetical protein
MPKRRTNGDERRRRLVAQEAARIIVNHGMRDYRAAKLKAAERLGFATRGSLPGNPEIERAVGEHLQLFGRESHEDLLRSLRRTALAAMRLLEAFTPRLVGPVLNGTADAHSAVNLHVFADSPEAVAFALSDGGLAIRAYERRLQSRRGRIQTYAGFEFKRESTAIQATVFPVDGIRQAPISPIDRKPMRRADEKTVRELLGEE